MSHAIADAQLDLLALLDVEPTGPEHDPVDPGDVDDGTPWVIVSCGMEKLSHRAPAGEMYLGSYHRAARRAAAALTRDDRTLILSGKYGLLRLTDEIRPYEMPINAPGAVPPLLVSRQMRGLGLARPGTRIIMLAGRNYSSVIRSAVCELNNPRRADREPMLPGQLVVDLPLRDTRGIGEQLAVFARIARGEDPTDAAIANRVDDVDEAPELDDTPARCHGDEACVNGWRASGHLAGGSPRHELGVPWGTSTADGGTHCPCGCHDHTACPPDDHAGTAPAPEASGEWGRGGVIETGPGAAFLRVIGCWPDGRRVTWTAPYDTVPGVHAGDVLPAYRCPHCLQIEIGEYGLESNHGVRWLDSATWHPDVADGWEDCTRQRATLLQARAALGLGRRTYQCRHCRIWTCELLRDVDRGPYACAGERTGHDWRPATPAEGAA